MSGTNITPELRKDFDIVTCGAFRDQLALVSCFVDGKPTAAICLTEISVPTTPPATT